MSFCINFTALAFQAFLIVLACFPSTRHPDKDTMNYAVVINCGIWILSVVYYFTYKKKYYTGPKSNLDEEVYLDTINGVEGSSEDQIDTVLSSSKADKYA
ncbi:uncharacterized protein CYBJADRAFT_172132 [Cyberlindnera jadinii NRRL Y-1542]|uniref:Uncharacterized protein n=1 Tax=Cyberlindnera jadinii (strain ATCC 18201 / CBS 1600 / BCRC 20928 / JCM 3617 / NBRC 0987 / NRRL Y-1542) TaxID=983966 RepID=A0A1E4S3T6_CYBJN|nr:hypothetical protein CYBJADRAFT_172132 [Cyberlindnera jadinii NRRL Y-1542]ODV74145.1 hypothetical protein CYBJADRAFT_172132 [Cyberlindnera jadinii NRRL Y-1542]